MEEILSGDVLTAKSVGGFIKPKAETLGTGLIASEVEPAWALASVDGRPYWPSAALSASTLPMSRWCA